MFFEGEDREATAQRVQAQAEQLAADRQAQARAGFSVKELMDSGDVFANLVGDSLELHNLNIISLEGMDELRDNAMPAFPGNVTVLQLDFNNLTDIPARAFHLFTGLKALNLSNNQIATLADGAFTGLEQLTKLDLTFNRLAKLPARAFAPLSNLKQLFLDSSRIEEIDVQAFVGLGNLETLYLTLNKLHQIPAGALRPLVKLKYLNLAGNNLSREEINRIRQEVGPFVKIGHASLADVRQPVTSIAHWLTAGQFESLYEDKQHNTVTLYLDAIPFTSIDGIKTYPWGNLITHLRISYSAISRIPAQAFAGLHLRGLRLNNNAIDQIDPQALVGLDDLEEFDVSDNWLTTIADVVAELQGKNKLKKLALLGNEITHIPANAFAGLPLQHLDLAYNPVQQIDPQAFQGLEQLQSLDLSYIDADSLPAGLFTPLKNLKELFLLDHDFTLEEQKRIQKEVGEQTQVHFYVNSRNQTKFMKYIQRSPKQPR